MTLEYASPEQLRGELITTATDVYALGVLLYVLFTGQHPAGPGPHVAAEMVKAHSGSGAPRMSDVRGGDPVELALANADRRGTDSRKAPSAYCAEIWTRLSRRH